jgi:hypothetical protein
MPGGFGNTLAAKMGAIDDLSEETKLFLSTNGNEIDSLLFVITARQSKRFTARVKIFE